ncbi:MAG TPA: DUF2510 domain-containing protein [Ilumatobacteraceae bacterium]|nr:DUF2510 domain-containing protein [Ilumatobacteraceae bacterium]
MEARSTPPGWYADPKGRFEYRYFNGVQWTSDVAANGQRYVDTSPQPIPERHQASDQGQRPPRGMAIAAFVTGLVGVVVGWVPFVFVLAAASAVLAFVFGIRGLRTARLHEDYGRGFAVTGIVLAPVGLAVCVGGFFFTKYVLHEFRDYIEPGPHELIVDRPCTVAGGRATLRGSIRNLDDRQHDYRIEVEFTSTTADPATTTVVVRDVGAGKTTEWSASAAIGGTSIDCTVTDVFGPLPFDIDDTG